MGESTMRISVLTSVVAGFVAFAMSNSAYAGTPVPEPASIGLGVLGLGVAALACIRRR